MSQADLKGRWALILGASSGFGAATCLLYTSAASDERTSVNRGGRLNINKKTK